MVKKALNKDHQICSEMTVLDTVSRYRKTEVVFKQYGKKAGECNCCQALFESLSKVVVKYGLNLEKLLADLKDSVGQ